MNDMVPAGTPGAMVTGGRTANPFDKANASGAVEAPPPDVLGGGSFGEIWTIDTDRKCFVNKKTNEARAELYIQVCAARANRVFFKDNERACWSDDAKSAYSGIACPSCPRISSVDAFNKYYEQHPETARPQYLGDGGRNIACSLRYTIKWHREFVPVQGGLVMYEHENPAMVNTPESSVYAMFGAKGLMPKLQQMGVDITTCVIKIKHAERENKAFKKMYSYADFEFVDLAQNVLAKVTKVVNVTDQTAAPSQAAAPAPAPAASYPAPGLPLMSGMAPAALPAPTLAPAVAPTAFPPAMATGLAPVPGITAAIPIAQPTTAGVAGFPTTAMPPAQPTTAGVPGFPGMGAPAPAAPAAAPAPAPAPAAPAPTFQELAKAQLIKDFSSLPEQLKPLVLSLVQVQKIEDVPFDRVLTASQAVTAARSYQPGQPAATTAAAPAAAPF